MIIVGAKIEELVCTGRYSAYRTLNFECQNIHEASKELWKCCHNSSPFFVYKFVYGEFHDTSTSNTWSVDSCGHTQKDYKKESKFDFLNRWDNSYTEVEREIL